MYMWLSVGNVRSATRACGRSTRRGATAHIISRHIQRVAFLEGVR
jgi:hypothetical protein